MPVHQIHPGRAPHNPFAVSRRRRPSLRDQPVAVAMTHHGVRVDPGLSTEALVALLLERELEAVPVVDAAGSFAGMVSVSDALRDFQDRDQVEEQVATPQIGEDGFHVVSLAPATVREIMRPSTLELMDTDRFARAVILMAYGGKSHLPVACSRCGGICVISALDVASWLARRDLRSAPEMGAPGGSARRERYAKH